MSLESNDKSCDVLGQLLSCYLDGQVTDEQAQQVEAHLAACPACARRLQQYRQIRDLVQSDKARSPVDVTSLVLGTMERDHLLNGLDELTHPPSPLGGKVLRRFAAAAMIGLVVFAGFYIFHFTSSTVKTPTRTLAMKDTPPAAPSYPQTKSKQAIFAKNMERAESPRQTIHPPTPLANRPTTLMMAKEAMQDDYKAEPISAGLAGPPASSKPVSHSTLAGRTPLYYRLGAPDMPSWMLAKERVLELMEQNRVTAVEEHDQLAESLSNKREFFYQAKKGLDLPAGGTRAQILATVEPEKFRTIYANLQQAEFEPVRQTLHPKLLKLVSPEQQSTALAYSYDLSRKNLSDHLRERGVVTEKIYSNTSVVSPAAGMIMERKSTTTARASQPATPPSTGPLTVLIDIELTPPAATVTSQPTTTTRSIPVSLREATEESGEAVPNGRLR